MRIVNMINQNQGDIYRRERPSRIQISECNSPSIDLRVDHVVEEATSKITASVIGVDVESQSNDKVPITKVSFISTQFSRNG